MDYNVVTEKDPQIQEYLKLLDDMSSDIDKCINNYQPYFNGDRFITDEELAKRLKVSRRTLMTYRSEGKIPYVALSGKILYREKDIEKILKENYVKAFDFKKTEL